MRCTAYESSGIALAGQTFERSHGRLAHLASWRCPSRRARARCAPARPPARRGSGCAALARLRRQAGDRRPLQRRVVAQARRRRAAPSPAPRAHRSTTAAADSRSPCARWRRALSGMIVVGGGVGGAVGRVTGAGVGTAAGFERVVVATTTTSSSASAPADRPRHVVRSRRGRARCGRRRCRCGRRRCRRGRGHRLRRGAADLRNLGQRRRELLGCLPAPLRVLRQRLQDRRLRAPPRSAHRRRAAAAAACCR